MAEAGFPPGVVNLVTGSGAEVGDAIVESPDVAVISFTGHIRDRASRIAERAGRRLKRVSLELGGKNGVVVLRRRGPRPRDRRHPVVGVRHDRPALHGGARGSSSSGPSSSRCSSASRRAPGRSDSARASTRRSTSGRSSTPAPSTRSARTSTSGAARASSSSAAAGRRGGDLAHGHFFEPTIFAGVGPMDRIGQEEIFGPVLSVIPVDDYGAAMTALNQTRYGLSSSDLHPRREHGVPGDARLRDRHRLRQRRARPAPRRTCRSAAGRRPATATARPATSRSTRTPNGSRSTSTSAAGSSGRRSTTSPPEAMPAPTSPAYRLHRGSTMNTLEHRFCETVL